MRRGRAFRVVEIYTLADGSVTLVGETGERIRVLRRDAANSSAVSFVGPAIVAPEEMPGHAVRIEEIPQARAEGEWRNVAF